MYRCGAVIYISVRGFSMSSVRLRLCVLPVTEAGQILHMPSIMAWKNSIALAIVVLFVGKQR